MATASSIAEKWSDGWGVESESSGRREVMLDVVEIENARVKERAYPSRQD